MTVSRRVSNFKVDLKEVRVYLSSSGVEKRNTKQYKAFQLGEKNKNPVSLYLNKALSLRDHDSAKFARRML